MKKLLVLTIVMALLAATAVPAFAAGGPPPGNGNGNGGGGDTGKTSRRQFALVGTITELDPEALTVTVLVASGNKLVKPYIGQELTLQTIEVTRFLLRNPDGVATPISFDDLAVGQAISANGQLVSNVWTTERITVGADLSCLP
jgi:hypothetical protein